MDIKEICDRANRNEPLPDFLQLHDSLLFLSLRHVYNDFHAGQIELDDAKREKNHLIYQHDLWKRRSDDHLTAARRYQKITIATEGVRSEIRKLVRDQAPAEQIINASLRLIGILDGVMPREWKEAAG